MLSRLDRGVRLGHTAEMTIWHLKKGSEKKFRWGHPWVFSSELAQSPKGIVPGELIELRDYTGAFLAIGYGHPNSLISFRTLSSSSKTEIDARFFRDRFTAHACRIAGVANESHRLCFAEGDFLPGLIIDRYALAAKERPSQTFVVQASTAGMDRLMPLVLEGLEEFVRELAREESSDSSRGRTQTEEGLGSSPTWEDSAVVVANDTKSRVMEGLPIEPKRVDKSLPEFWPAATRILVQGSLSGIPAAQFDVDLIGGQKTGFFLDQRSNVAHAARVVQEILARKKSIRVLDLFCYVGQWGTQLAHLATQLGGHAEVTLVDASQTALELAAKNVERHGGRAVLEKRDILGEIGQFENGAYDVVICDPPAFVKKKKDLPTGSQAYFKLNREAIRKTARGGLFVSCSCSGLFDETEFRTMLAKVSVPLGDRVRWVLRGSHSVDHPQRPEFPQGTYLKSWMGVIE